MVYGAPDGLCIVCTVGSLGPFSFDLYQRFFSDRMLDGLAAALALLARDRGEVPICFQLLTYPMLDDRTATTATPNPFTGEFVWTPEANRFAWSALLGHEPGVAGVSPYAAAARATDLSGLPPAYISVGALDLFVDEDIAYAQRLLRAGVPTELHIIPGAYHAFEMAFEAPITVAAQGERRTALARAFRTAQPDMAATGYEG